MFISRHFKIWYRVPRTKWANIYWVAVKCVLYVWLQREAFCGILILLESMIFVNFTRLLVEKRKSVRTKCGKRNNNVIFTNFRIQKMPKNGRCLRDNAQLSLWSCGVVEFLFQSLTLLSHFFTHPLGENYKKSALSDPNTIPFMVRVWSYRPSDQGLI